MIGRSCKREAEAVAELEREGFHLAGEAEVLRLGPARARCLSVVTPGFTSSIAASIHSRALLVGVPLRAVARPTLKVR